ncbi:MAG: sensor domain-containing diguanylate cyclase [Candidatus Omnitrophica bacterium]|nr:sensor domain-containing diguanylate cyclase [Candidatus Omnitrophota bacterium]
MKHLETVPYQRWAKQLLLITAFAILSLLSYLVLLVLNRAGLHDSRFISLLALISFAFFIPTILAWFSSRLIAVFFFVPVACFFSFLTNWVMQSSIYLLFIPVQAGICVLLYYLDQKKDAEVIDHNVEIEKAINEKNDMELTFKEEGTSISVYFEKYTRYYNLKNLAADFSATLSLKELAQLIVSKTLELIPHGTLCLLYLADTDVGGLSLVASKSVQGDSQQTMKGGDVLDFWVLRHRQSLFVSDIQKDFRFDIQKSANLNGFNAVIASPLIHAGKPVGTLRLNSVKPNAFSTDELRFLDAISTLASSAISNSILFQKTEELAIRDSVTGLYVQRYFRERLSEEHGRSLLTNTPLTLLMCDLDHFKEINDRYGHALGDFVLTKTSELMTKKVSHGIVSRYGGEEFAILLPNLSAQAGQNLAESIRSSLAGMNLEVRREVIPLTISIGVASIPADTFDSEELIRIADQRLYQAKKAGRNRVCGAG